MIQGQEKICNLIDKSTLDSFPRTLMLVGQQGSGKHLLTEYISEKLFNLPIMDITETLDQETIDQIYQRVEPYIYIVEANKISVKEENTILKFLEEPLKNAYIILLAETDMGILPTILNRCQIWHLQNYKKEFLAQFLPEGVNDEYILEIAQTPGQVQQLSSVNFSEMIELADRIIDKINVASVSNTLTLSNKLAFKKETDKYDVKLFVKILLSRLSHKYAQPGVDTKVISAYMLTSNLNKNLYVKNLDYRALFEKYLIDLRYIMRGDLL